MSQQYDAILMVSFGGPEQKADVLPFLENVTRGRNIPRERLLEVAEHYYHFGGRSPINDQTRNLMSALREELDRHHISLPLLWGCRNWHPFLSETMQEATSQGMKRLLAIIPAAYSSYSSCRQYRENIQSAQQSAGDSAPEVDRIRFYFNHPDFIAANVNRIQESLTEFDFREQQDCHLLFTAHSLPLAMANTCDYVSQLSETCRLVCEELHWPRDRWELVYQSRSGRPSDPWLEPDILDSIKTLHQKHIRHLIISPIGFLSDHIEVLFDLDEEALLLCQELNMNMVRAKTVGTHPLYVRMLRELIQERLESRSKLRACGTFAPHHFDCPEDCCPAPVYRG